MTSEVDKLLELLSKLPSRLPESVIDQLIKKLDEQGQDNLRGNLHTMTATPASRQLLLSLDDLWLKCPEFSNLAMSAALRSAQLVDARLTNAQNIKIIWTGPATEAVPLRRTEQALKEVIDEATSSLLIVSFVTYKVDEIMDSLKQARDRGVALQMVYETEKASGGKLSFDQIDKIQALIPGANIYTWPLPKRPTNKSGRPGTIHAKCAVADRQKALISSANLTEFALELNMELGVLISGGFVARAIADHFQELISRGILEPIDF